MKYNFFYENHKLKLISVLESLVRVAIVWLISGSLKTALIFSVFEIVVKIFQHNLNKKVVQKQKDDVKIPTEPQVVPIEKNIKIESVSDLPKKKVLNYSSNR